MNRKKVGLLGGNFNPIHHAHLMMADQVAQRLDLDEIYLLPEYLPPHQDEKKTIAAEHRLKMLELAINSNPRLKIEALEFERQGKSYTYDTIKILKERHPEIDYYFIIGSDMVDYLHTWKNIDQLCQMVHFVAVKRTEQVLESQYPVTWVEMPVLPISSTMIRELFQSGIEPKYLLPDLVIEYIKDHELY